MKKRLVPILILTLVSSLAVLVPTMAQAPPPPPGGPGPQGGPGMGDPPEVVLTEAFSLTEAQVASLKTLMDTRRQAVQSLMPKAAAAEKALHEALQAASPDAANLGNLLLATKTIRDQIRQTDQAVATDFRAILTADQQKKLDAYLAAKDSVPVVMTLQRLGF